ncbi:MAG: ankyrin repeat domain-containing protein [Alphaproteobacteria bacterium]|nr:ankyrin repeat domain-containing protein [Alphaproteobacteria bacterium]
MVQALLASGLKDINHQNKGGYTGLMHAVNYCTSENTCKDIVNLLVKTGVDINIKNSENLSAWDLALQSKNQEVVALLEGNDTDQSFSCMISGETHNSDTDSI